MPAVSTQPRSFLLAIFVLFLLSSCRSFQPVSKSYLIKGDDYFINLQDSFSVVMHPLLPPGLDWSDDDAPFQATKLKAADRKLLKTLGYKGRDYDLVFTSQPSAPYPLIALVNRISKPGKSPSRTPRLTRLSKKEYEGGVWYQEYMELDGESVYHAVLPVRNRRQKPQYLSLIYLDRGTKAALDTIQELAAVNALHYSMKQNYMPLKTVFSCPDSAQTAFHDYIVPDQLSRRNEHLLLKVYTRGKNKELAYYSLLNSDAWIGSFKLCPGEYRLEYSTLNHRVLWSETLSIQAEDAP